MSASTRTSESSFSDRSPVARSYKRYLAKASLVMFAVIIVSALLSPLLYMVTTSFQQPSQIATAGAPIWPATPDVGTFEGNEYPIFTVTIDGATRQLMLIEPGRESSVFVDPSDPNATRIEWQGRWRTLEQSWRFSPLFENYTTVWSQLNFPRLLTNTFGIAALSTLGAVLSSILVAYGFARFRFPGRNVFFFILLGTIILPTQVTLLPQYVIFTWLGWNGTWLPLIVPHFFANAFNVFLLRQYFMTIPRELDESAISMGPGRFESCAASSFRSPSRRSRPSRCSTSSGPGTTSSCPFCTSGTSQNSSRCRSGSSSTTPCTRASRR